MSEDKIQPWKIYQNLHHGFVYVVDHDGKKVCTVYGSDDIKMQRAMAIAEIPLMLSKTDTIAETLDRAIKCMQHVVDDLNGRARNGVVPIGNGAWWQLNEALTELKKRKGDDDDQTTRLP